MSAGRLLVSLLCLSLWGCVLGDWITKHINLGLGSLFTFVVGLLPWVIVFGAVLLPRATTSPQIPPQKYFEGLFGIAFGAPWVCRKCGADNFPKNKECWRCHEGNVEYRRRKTR